MIALAVIAAMTGGLILLVNPFIGLLSIVVLIPLALVPQVGSGFLGIFTSATPIKMIGAVTFVSAFFHHIVSGRKWDFFKEPTVMFYILFLIYIIMNGFAMPSSFTRENFTYYISIALLGFVVLTLVNSPKRLHLILWLFMTSVFIVSVNSILNLSQSESGAIRSAGGTFDPNYFAISLLPFIAISFYNIGAEKNKILKFFSLVFSLTYLGAFALTQSRGGFVGLVAMILVAFISSRKKFVAFILVLIASVLIFSFMPEHFWERFKYAKIEVEEGDEMNEALGSAIRRHYLALAARDIFFDHPVFGVGIGNYYWECPLYYPIWAGRAHNMHLEILAELGAVGYLLFLGMIVSFFKCLRRSSTAGSPYDLMAKAFFIGHMGFLVSAWFLHAQQEKGFWLIMFLAVAMERIWRNQSKDKAKQTQPVPMKVGAMEEEKPKKKKLKFWRM